MTDAPPVTTGGARARRRGLYGPPPRLTRRSPVTGRLLWHIGDWGRASEHIGLRWEHIAGALAQRRLRNGDQLLVLAATPALMSAVISSGLPHADALRAWSSDGRLALEPLDFKWSLETASARQVSSDTLRRLLEADLSSLADALRLMRERLDLDELAEIEPHDGRFVAPEHPANRAALDAEPGLPSVLLPVDAHEFFQSLPGWPAATILARLEGADLERLERIDAVERYYRLGAGVTGALTRLETGLFETQPCPIDAAAMVAQLRRAGHARTLNSLLLYLEHELAARKTLEDRLAQLPRVVYPFGRLRTDLAGLGVPRSVLDSRGALGRAYGEVTREEALAIRAAGQEMVASGMDAEAALNDLAAHPARFSAVATAAMRAVAARLAAAERA
ncbi:MAG: hypothetical protein JOZ81_05135 [Chloroflexi bacterium]|nr:hypothetical protein [Chloroflexota bacterium]